MVFVFVFVLTFFLFSSPIQSAFVDRGDVNFDGVVDIRDAVMVKQYILGIQELTEEEFARADVNLDGVIDIKDLVFIIKILILQLEDPEYKDPTSPTS